MIGAQRVRMKLCIRDVTCHPAGQSFHEVHTRLAMEVTLGKSYAIHLPLYCLPVRLPVRTRANHSSQKTTVRVRRLGYYVLNLAYIVSCLVSAPAAPDPGLTMLYSPRRMHFMK